MKNNDLINSIFEITGAIFIWMNVVSLYKDKIIKGVFWPVWMFYTLWGIWNLYYYTSIDHMLSFYAGIFLALGNFVWVCFAVKFKFFNKGLK